MNRRTPILIGITATIGLSALWHGPLGAGERLARQVETVARRQLDDVEMFQVQAHLQRSPLSRRLILTGPADDFQRRELVRRLDPIPGVVDVKWDAASLPQEGRSPQ